jgi:hypothetical protein
MIPEYYQSFRDVFNKRKLSPAEQVEWDKFLEENLAKGYI